MFGISGEHLIILAVILLFLGPKKLPELSHSLGKAIKNFKDSMSGVEEAKYRKIDDVKKEEPKPGQDPHQPTDSSEPKA